MSGLDLNVFRNKNLGRQIWINRCNDLMIRFGLSFLY